MVWAAKLQAVLAVAICFGDMNSNNKDHEPSPPGSVPTPRAN